MKKRIIIAGGGTGGHIFPAIAIANALKKKNSDIEILFVGAKGKMEMEKVPQAGFRIEGLDIAGFNRSSLIKNIGLPFKLIKSFFQVRNIMKEFKPTAVIGVGGYSSFPVLRYAQAKGIPSFIHESNSFAGKSNIWLGKKATKIFVAVEGMERFFPKDKIVITGNPVRSSIVESNIEHREALRFFSLEENRKTVLVVGGSLGAKSINEAIDKHLELLLSAGLQLIWQTGKTYVETAKERVKGKEGVWVNDFITQMDLAYTASDMVVSRAGAMAVSELAVVKKPVLFIPYPFAAEDHQTANAMHLVKANAAMMIKDKDALDNAVQSILELAKDETRQIEMKKNIESFSHKDADEKIADEVLRNIY
jgi:UDP-N-acetylglucosamine--N-acetylmuramyl-(pentapeptide) pyrophosphoryl-undecaprenol N-acetylglucosamine transferase